MPRTRKGNGIQAARNNEMGSYAMNISELDECGKIIKQEPLPRGKRFTYLQKDMLEEMPWIKGDVVREVNGLTVIKSESDFVMITVLKLLYTLSRESLTFTKLHYECGIRLKRSFLDYLNHCVEMKFIIKMKSENKNQFYKLSAKGHDLLDMFYI